MEMDLRQWRMHELYEMQTDFDQPKINKWSDKLK